MTLLEYKNKTELDSKTQPEQAKFICYYQFKENNITTFSMMDISKWFIEFGFRQINTSRLKDSLLKGKNKTFIYSHGNKNLIEFVPIQLDILESEYSHLWANTEIIESNSELIDETKFCGKRSYLDKIIKQINNCYKSNCYDACAVMMRRLFEILLIHSYQYNHIDDVIKDSDGRFKMLERIVSDAVSNKTLNITKRVSEKFDTIRNIGNFSAHNITYIAGQKDINDIKLSYRLMLDELYTKAGLQ